MKTLVFWSRKFAERFWTRVSHATAVCNDSLPKLRIITGLFLLAIYHPTFSWIEKMPSAFFEPPILSISNLVHGFPRHGILLAIDLLLLTSNIAIILGIKSRASTMVYVALSLVASSFAFSFGAILHNILLYAMLFCMALSGWGTAIAMLPDQPSKFDLKGRSFALLGVLICFGFVSAGYEKALNWVDFNTSTSGFAAWFYQGYYEQHRVYLLAPLVTKIPFWCFEIFDYLAVFFELSSIVFLLTGRKMWRLWLLAACVFHLLNTVFLNIPFTWDFIVFIAFLDLSQTGNRIRKWWNNNFFRYSFLLLIAVLVLLKTRQIFTYKLSSNIFFEDYLVSIDCYFAVAVWLAAIALFIYNSRKNTSINFL